MKNIPEQVALAIAESIDSTVLLHRDDLTADQLGRLLYDEAIRIGGSWQEEAPEVP